MASDSTSDDMDITKFISGGGQLSFGAMSGLASGYALRQGGKIVGLLVGTGFMFVQSLAYTGYIEVDWRKVERDYKNILDRNNDGKITMDDFKIMFNDTSELLKFNMPSGAGFTSGLAYGLTGSLKMTALAPVLYGGASAAAIYNFDHVTDKVDDLKKWGTKGSMDMLGSIQNSVQNVAGSLPKVDPEVKYKLFLKSLSLQDLRDLEANLKNNEDNIPQLRLLNYSAEDKEPLLDQIETAKKVIKGKI